MSRIVNQPIDVTLGPDGHGGVRPTAFRYRGERHIIQLTLDHFLMALPWWEDPKALVQGPAEVDFWRVQTTKGGVFELVQEPDGWRLWKSYD